MASQCAAVAPVPVAAAAVSDCSCCFAPLAVAVFTFMLGVVVGWLASKMAAGSKPLMHNVLTQSTVTYTWWTNEPRFKVNGCGVDGAWRY